MAVRLISELVSDMELPKMLRVRQTFPSDCIAAEEIEAVVAAEMERCFDGQIKPGMSVAITGGSRGISNIDRITKGVVRFVKAKGGKPFVFPSMGSHGGATAEGQLAVLESYGLTEDNLGCPIRASMEVCSLGRTEDGTEVFLDRLACEADATILCNRVKAHTDFRGDYESGLVKMAVIGMGKQVGADSAHASGFRNFPKLLPEVGAFILQHSNILGGLAILENALEQTSRLCALGKQEIMEKEPELLREAKANMPNLLLESMDVLVIGRAGKDISGNGMDPNITGRFTIPELSCDKAARIAVLELSEATHGNFNGIGLADLITQRLYEQCDMDATYPNAFTSTVLSDVKLPFIVASDKECFQVAIKTCNGIDKARPRVVYIQDTLHLEYILVSEALLSQVESNPRLELLGPAEALCFDAQGNMQKDLQAEGRGRT